MKRILKRIFEMKMLNYHYSLELDAGWYAGENWTLFDCNFLTYLEGLDHIVLFNITIGKFGVSLGLDFCKIDPLQYDKDYKRG